VAPARAAEVLRGALITLHCTDEPGRVVADRVANLGQAAEPAARIRVGGGEQVEPVGLKLHLGVAAPAGGGRLPVIALATGAPAEGRFIAAFGTVAPVSEAVVLVPDIVLSDEHAAQSIAVQILDGVCAVLSDGPQAVVS
jgi:hypothetical protein